MVTAEDQAEAERMKGLYARRQLKRLSRALGTHVGDDVLAPGRMANAIKAVLDDRGIETLKRQRAILQRLLEITEAGIVELEALKPEPVDA